MSEASRERRPAAIVAVMLAAVLVTLDISIVYTALPAIARDLRQSAATTVWIVNAFQLSMVAAVIPLAALGEAIGHRRVHLAGAALFTAASLGCALATSLPLLLAARVVQGVGAAASVAVITALIRSVYPPTALGRGLGLYALVVNSSLSIGPTVASLVLTVGSWQWLFVLALPIGVAALVLGLRHLPAGQAGHRRFDALAALLCAGLFGLLTSGLGRAAHGAGWIELATLGAGALACGVALMRRQRGHPAPMLAVDLFARPVFALSAVTSVLSFVVQALAFVSLPFLFREVMGRSQLETGLLMTPWPLVLAAMSIPAGRLSDRVPAGALGGGGLALLAAGMASLALLGHDAGAADVAWRLALCAAGFALFQSPNMNAIMSSAPAARSGGASGVVATSRMLGQATGVALAAACFQAGSTGGPSIALWLGAAVALAACLTSLARLRVRRG